MTKQEALKLFEDKKVRTVWDDEQEKWYFSIIDVIAILTNSPDPKRYWSVLKSRIKKEGHEHTTICSTLKLRAADGKMRLTDVADTLSYHRQKLMIICFFPKKINRKKICSIVYLTNQEIKRSLLHRSTKQASFVDTSGFVSR